MSCSWMCICLWACYICIRVCHGLGIYVYAHVVGEYRCMSWLHVCMYGHPVFIQRCNVMWLHVCMYVSTLYVWRLEVDVRCFPQLLSALYTEAGFHLNPEFTDSTSLACQCSYGILVYTCSVRALDGDPQTLLAFTWVLRMLCTVCAFPIVPSS